MRDIIYFSKSNTVFVLDQTLLPFKVHYVEAKNYKAIIKLIKNLSIRGAPAIGVSGSFGAFLALRGLTRRPRSELPEIVYNRLREIAAARPTAVNLMWSIKRFENIINLKIRLSPRSTQCTPLHRSISSKFCSKIAEKFAKILPHFDIFSICQKIARFSDFG